MADINKAKTIGELIKAYWGVAGVVATMVMGIYTYGVTQERKSSHTESYYEKIDKLVVSDSLQSLKMNYVFTGIDSLKSQQRFILREVKRSNTSIGILKTQVGNHIIQTSQDKRDILNWVNAWEGNLDEKKNGSYQQTR